MPLMRHHGVMTRDWPRLHRRLRERREGLGITRSELAERTGLGLSTIKNFEGAGTHEYHGKPPASGALIEREVRWGPGSLESILEGGEPTLLEDPGPLADEEEVPVDRWESPAGRELVERHVIDPARAFAGLTEELARASPADRRVLLQWLQALVDKDGPIDSQ